MHGPASMTVTGTTVPFASNTCVIPTFRPNNPLGAGRSALKALVPRENFLPADATIPADEASPVVA